MARDPHRQLGQRNIFTGAPVAIIFALLLIGTFTLVTAQTTMPSGERWAALVTFGLLAFAYVLQGSIGIYDALGRVVRHNIRALIPLLALFPALYVSYTTTVNEFTWRGLLTALMFAALPSAALLSSRGKRTPTLLDFVGVAYLWLSLELSLIPAIELPQQGGLVGFFYMGALPLLLLLLAARGWPGLGFSWFLSWSDLLVSLAVTVVLLAVLTPLALALGLMQPVVQLVDATDLLSEAVFIYFLIAIPEEIVFRGIMQNGLRRVIESAAHQNPAEGLRKRLLSFIETNAVYVSLIITSIVFGVAHFNDVTTGWSYVGLATLTGLGYGWVYQRTGKVTAAAVTHMLVLWCWSIFLSGVH